MNQDFTNSQTNCPQCQKEFDTLRCGAVSVAGGEIIHFCSNECRETYLNKNTVTQTEKAGKSHEENTQKENKKIREVKGATSSAAVDLSSKTKTETKGSSHSPGTALFEKWRIYEFAAFFLWAVFSFIIGMTLSGVWFFLMAVFSLGFSFAIEFYLQKKLGNINFAEILIIPSVAAALFIHSLLAGTFFMPACVLTCLTLSKRLMYLLETYFRKYSGVLTEYKTLGKSAAFETWRDNSDMHLKYFPAFFVMEWFIYPLSISVSVIAWFAGLITLNESIAIFAAIIVVVYPRSFRLAVFDAFLGAAINVQNLKIILKDAKAVQMLGQTRYVFWMDKSLLFSDDINVVDWTFVENEDTAGVLAALGSVLSGVETKLARAVTSFIESAGVTFKAAREVTTNELPGIIEETSFGHLVFGDRLFLLENKIATSTLEKSAQKIEKSGRDAFFVSLGGQLRAVFGIERTPGKNVVQTLNELKRKGLELSYSTSSQMEPCMAMGAKLGIENVFYNLANDKPFENLANLYDSGEHAAIVGTNFNFEENINTFAATISLGKSKDFHADACFESKDLRYLPTLFKATQLAIARARANLLRTFFIMLLGLGFVLTWHNLFVVAVAGSIVFMGSALNTFCPRESFYKKIKLWIKLWTHEFSGFISVFWSFLTFKNKKS